MNTTLYTQFCAHSCEYTDLAAARTHEVPKRGYFEIRHAIEVNQRKLDEFDAHDCEFKKPSSITQGGASAQGYQLHFKGNEDTQTLDISCFCGEKTNITKYTKKDKQEPPLSFIYHYQTTSIGEILIVECPCGLIENITNFNVF